VLNGRLALHDIHDVEAYCAHILQRARLTLTPQDHEDALAYLTEEAWILSRTYRPGTRSFSGYAGQRLPQRLTDWQRKRKDTRYPSNTKYTLTYTDDPAIRRQLERTHTNGSNDDPRDRNTDQLVRLLRTRSRQPTRNNNESDPRTASDAA
jgi:hypothetical protein